jgi:putative FmdB family regulatory protein
VPIYEFYCADCHTVFNFFARKPDTEKRPTCPRCGRPNLDRKVSRFAISKGRSEPRESDDLPADFDEAKMERVMAEMAREGEGTDEDDPRQMARMMRKLHEATGMDFGKGMEEAIRRMEAGEDPDKIEEEMGDLLEEEPGFGESGRSLRQLSKRLKPPEIDDTLYDM